MPSDIKHFRCHVVGVRHPNADGSSRQAAIRKLEAFESLRLVAEPNNPHDANAVRVVRWETGEQIGYLNRKWAEHVCSRRRRGYRVGASVLLIWSSRSDRDEGQVKKGRTLLEVEITVVEAEGSVSDAEVQSYVDRVVSPEARRPFDHYISISDS